MTDRSVYYRLTDAGWSKRLVPHISKPWPEGRKPQRPYIKKPEPVCNAALVDTISAFGIYDAKADD